MKLKVRVKYFGILKDITGKKTEEVNFEGERVKEFLEKLFSMHMGLKKQRRHFKIAIDEKIVDEEYILRDNCTVVLLPPVSGG